MSDYISRAITNIQSYSQIIFRQLISFEGRLYQFITRYA